MASLPTYIACPVSFFSSIYIHCIWVSSWTHLSSPSIECISSSIPFFRSLCYLPPSSSIQSSPFRLCISPWAYCISPQHPLFHSALPLISIQPHHSFLPLSNGGWWFFCFCQLSPNTSIQPSLEFFDKGSSLIAAPPSDLFEFLYILIVGPPSLLNCSQLFYFPFLLQCFPKVIFYLCEQLLYQFHF